MLRDQVVSLTTLIGVGEELFYSPHALRDLDWTIIGRIKREVDPSVFRLIYIGTKGNEEVYRTLQQAGVPFFRCAFLHVGVRSSEDYVAGLCSAADYVFAPVVCSNLRMSYTKSLDIVKDKFITCMAYFSRYPENYTKERFYQMMTAK